MKHEKFVPALQNRQQADLRLCPVLGKSADGLPVLANTDSDELLVLSDMLEPQAGMVAVCKEISGRTVVLGYVTTAQMSGAGMIRQDTNEDGWISLGFGEAQIRMHPDGRMRLKAQDITIDSAGRMGLRGGWIDLN